MNLDTCEPTRKHGHKTPKPLDAKDIAHPAGMRYAVQHHGVQAWVAREHLEPMARCGVAL
jgi:hypothetical protein